MGNSSFFNNPNDYQAVDEGGEGSGFYDGPAYTEIDPVAIANSVAATAASAAASEASHQASEDDADASAASAAEALASQNAAATSAANALTSENNADASEAVALAQAGIATTQAGIATTKASEAGVSASSALISASNASDSEAAALASENAAATSETNSATSETNAANSASAAATSATNAAGVVQAAAGTATPLVDGTAAVGSGVKWAREDHRHPTDTSRAPTANPTFTGTVTIPTPTSTDNSTKAASTAFVKDALAALVASSPSALDTLNELAAALGNDPNFATTITNALALKAPLVSPALSGTPTAPTPTVGDNSTKIATTAFVLANGGTGGRTLLTAPRTYYVRTDGNDANNGLVDSAGGAFLTIQKAIDTVASLDMGIYQVTIQVRSGTYTGQMLLKNWVGALRPIIQGNTTTPSNVLISTVGHCVVGDGTMAWTIQGFRLTSSAGGCIRSLNAGAVYFGSCDFHTSADIQIWAQSAGTITCISGYNVTGSVTGGNQFHIAAADGGVFYNPSAPINIPSALAFPGGFVLCSRNGTLYNTGAITGAGVAGTTGPRYNCSLNGVIYVAGSGATYFPGNSTGATTTGGQYA